MKGSNQIKCIKDLDEVLDSTSDEDWYKIVIYGENAIYVEVVADPDLMVEVRLYVNYLKVDEDTSTSRGDDCSVSYSKGSTTTYYVRVKLVGSYTAQGHPGDWYDISIDIYPS